MMATTTKRKARAKKPAAEKAPAVAEAVEVEKEVEKAVEEVADFGRVEDAAKIRVETGMVVELNAKWGPLRPRIVSLRYKPMAEFIAGLKRKEIHRHQVEKRPGKPPVASFVNLPDENIDRVHIRIVLEMLRGDGQGTIKWHGADPVNLVGASTEEVRDAFKGMLEAADLQASPWLTADLIAAGMILVDVDDTTVLDDAKKKRACGLRYLLAEPERKTQEVLRALAELEKRMSGLQGKTPTS